MRLLGAPCLMLVLGGCCLPPRDGVDVRVEPIPQNTRAVIVVAKAGEALAVLPFLTCAFGWSASPPNGAVMEAFRTAGETFYYRWKEAEEYVVLVRDDRREWSSWWFRSEEVPLHDRSWLVGGGSCTFDLTSKQRRPVTDDFLRAAGITHGLAHPIVKRGNSGFDRDRWDLYRHRDCQALGKAVSECEQAIARADFSNLSHVLIATMDILDRSVAFVQWLEPEATALERIYSEFAEIRSAADGRDKSKVVEHLAAMKVAIDAYCGH